MATVGHYQDGLEGLRSRIRVTVETAFYGNNVMPVASVRDAYLLAKNSPGTVELT
ncbi:MAG: phosphoenolpyruvate carboxykinase, partial [Eubacteriaceae bacterium]|nr:phosphoenolpyruvate carboxykinase [Eubacteriaceae bacterium]